MATNLWYQPVGIIQLAKNKKVTLISSSALTILQIEAGNFLGKSLEQLVRSFNSKVKIPQKISFNHPHKLTVSQNGQNILWEINRHQDGYFVTLQNIKPLIFLEKGSLIHYQLSKDFSSNKNLNQILSLNLKHLIDFFNVDGASLMLYSPKDKLLHLLVRKTKLKNISPPKVTQLKLGEGIAGLAAKIKQPIAVTDTRQDQRFISPQKALGRALLSCPLINKNKLIGVINITNRQPHQFSIQEKQFISIIAARLAVLIENAQLAENIRKQLFDLKKLNILSQNLLSSHSLRETLKIVTEQIINFFQLSGCAILLGDKEKRTLKIVYHKGLNLKPNAQPTIPFNACLSGWCLKNKNHLYTDDLINHPLLYPPNRPLIKKSKLKTLLCIPLIKDNQPIGTLNLYHRGQRQFSEEEIDLLKTAANQIAQAITNIQLYQQTTKFLSRLFLDKQLLDKIFANSADGIMVTDHHFKVIIWNKAMERFTGISAAKAYHQECWKFLCGHGCPKSFTCPAVVKWKKGEQNPYEEINLVGNDRRIWLGGTHSIITDKKGKMIHTVGIFRDITKLKELAQSQNDFISMATHELRTPLTIIKGYLSMLLGGDGGQLNGKQWNFFNKAFQSTERLVDLVEDLLATQRIDQNRLDLSIIPVNIIELIEEIVTDFIHKASEKKIILNFINRPSKAIYALADRLRTKQILSNLIDNAIKYTRESGEVKISYSLGDLNHQLEENYLTIEVMDSGIGIPKEKTNEIFDKFSRLNNPESIKAGGTGLGLYIVKHLIEQQNGQIWVKSNPKKGSVFSFTLPLVPNEQPKSKLI